MTTEVLTVHEALCKYKINKERIEDLRDSRFIAYKQKTDSKINGVNEEDVVKSIQSDFDKIMGLVKESDAIKAALSLSNASTKITVAGKEYTMAEALYILGEGLPAKKRILNTLKNQYSVAVNYVNRKNGDELDERVEKFISANYGSKEKTDSKAIEEASKNYRELHTYELIDPMNLKKQIDALQQWVDDMESSIDSAMQTSNATTQITIEF